MKKGYKALVAEADEVVEAISIEDGEALRGKEDVVFVDIRDVRELWREGKLPGAVHAPRGMLEFWVDPDSPYHREVFAEDKRFVFYCAAGWRSALAAKSMQEMGLPKVCHMTGGFTAWKEAGLPVEDVERK
ncbi:MAG: rhodanese-like domain-containing protein [Pseudomonadales bacterium]